MNEFYERLYGEVLRRYPRSHIDKQCITLDGDSQTGISCYALGKEINPEQLMYIIETMLNSMGSDPFRKGLMIGACARHTHRTLQRSFVGLCLGMLYGIAQQKHSDARNETAIATAKKIADKIDADELLLGAFI